MRVSKLIIAKLVDGSSVKANTEIGGIQASNQSIMDFFGLKENLVLESQQL